MHNRFYDEWDKLDPDMNDRTLYTVPSFFPVIYNVDGKVIDKTVYPKTEYAEECNRVVGKYYEDLQNKRSF